MFRDAQAATLGLVANTAMATGIDIGDPQCAWTLVRLSTRASEFGSLLQRPSATCTRVTSRCVSSDDFSLTVHNNNAAIGIGCRLWGPASRPRRCPRSTARMCVSRNCTVDY
jgi:hypothetical protein